MRFSVLTMLLLSSGAAAKLWLQCVTPELQKGFGSGTCHIIDRSGKDYTESTLALELHELGIVIPLVHGLSNGVWQEVTEDVEYGQYSCSPIPKPPDES
ncbi:hypothetical protein E6O75_ATG09943 [Venturia nashicola]|uniref:Uncharacterized protein n=1 Tax=Venturia nashicola TaxID=86259 RepID=A0A4Z1NQS3_9PEZI|nr:hypothetical protein E6O75_ATG09943 [Venturia nashicola]